MPGSRIEFRSMNQNFHQKADFLADVIVAL